MAANNRDLDWLLGRRFVADFVVVQVDPGADRAVLRMRGERYVIGLDELQTIIERGFVVEWDGAPKKARH